MPWKRALLLALLLGGSVVVSIGEDNRAAFADVLLDPLSLLAQRSPGQRTGALLRTKPEKVNLAALTGPFGPTERVLSTVRTRPPIEFGPDAPILGSIIPDMAEPVFVVPEALPGPIPAAIVPPGLPFIGESVPAPPGGSSPSETPEIPVTPSPVIPEPATWLTMILGFLAAGLAMRRRHYEIRRGLRSTLVAGTDMDRHAGA